MINLFVKEIVSANVNDSKNILLSIIIANYNGSQYFLKLLNQIIDILDVNSEVIIVDNDSTDSSYEQAKTLLLTMAMNNKHIKRIVLIRLRKNYGPALAYDLGVLASKAEYILLINNDILFDRKFSLKNLIKLFRRLEAYDVGAITVKICKLLNPATIDSVGTIIDTFFFAWEYGMNDLEDRNKYSAPYYVHSVPLVFSLMRRETFLKAGMIDPLYFAGYEDLDLSLRIQLMGLRLLYVPLFKVYHLRGGASSRREFKPLMAYLFARAHLYNLLTYENILVALLKAIVRGLFTILYATYNASAKILYYSFIKPSIDVLIKERYYALRRRIYAPLLKNSALIRKRLYRGVLPLKLFIYNKLVMKK